MNILKDFDEGMLYELRDMINCSPNFTLETKQAMMDLITDQLRELRLVDLMKPIAKSYIEERRGG